MSISAVHWFSYNMKLPYWNDDVAHLNIIRSTSRIFYSVIEPVLDLLSASSVVIPLEAKYYDISSYSTEALSLSPTGDPDASSKIPTGFTTDFTHVPSAPSSSILEEVEIKDIRDVPFKHTLPFPIEKLPSALPHAHIEANANHEAIIWSCLKSLNQFNTDVFSEDAIWRDLYALTGTLRTFNGQSCILSIWAELECIHHQAYFALIPSSSKIIRVGAESSWIQARFSFETFGKPATLCSCQIGVIPDSTLRWKIWLLTPILKELKGFQNPDFIKPGKGNRTSQRTNNSMQQTHFDCVVVGAGFAGLCLAGCLKVMGIHSVVLERSAEVGDNWLKRYDSTRFEVFDYVWLGVLVISLIVHTSRDYKKPISSLIILYAV